MRAVYLPALLAFSLAACTETAKLSPEGKTASAPVARPAPVLRLDGLAPLRLKLEAGSLLKLDIAPPAGRRLVLLDKVSGLPWFDGTQPETLRTWLIRGGPIELESRLDGAPAQTVTIEVDDSAGSLFPGLLAKVIRPSSTLSSPAPDTAFVPPAGAIASGLPAEGLAPATRDYPAWRNAESVVRHQTGQGQPSFAPASYWHLPLPHPSFGAAPEFPQAFKLPLGDLALEQRVAVRLESLLRVERGGLHSLRLASSLPGRALFAGQSRELVPGQPLELAAELTEGSLAPLEIVIDRPAGKSEVSLAVSLREPGAAAFVPLSGARLLHRAPPAQAAAWKSFRDAKRPAFKAPPPKELAALPADTAALDFAQSFPAQRAAAAELATKPSLAAAERLLAVDLRRLQLLRDKPELRVPGGFSKINGDALQIAEEARSLFEDLLRHPRFQEQALARRAELLSYASLISGRSFFSETHAGTNDGYGDQHNFLVNNRRVAHLWDEPAALDAARSLLDNHFNYGFGTKDAMHADGVICFHAANGRHVNMGGYGHDWVTRILGAPNFGTPWSHTPEQCRRMAEFLLAFEWFFYKDAMAFTTAGRHNTGTGKMPWHLVDRALKLPAPLLDADTRRRLEALSARRDAKTPPLEGDRFFFRHLQLIHRRADYYLDVKMNSPIVGGIETFAGATPGNLSFADGVTTFLRSGQEYRPIHAYNIPESLWRFRALPGTTQLDLEGVNNDGHNNPDRYRSGAGSLAGGLSDGRNGFCAFDFVSHGNNASRARKFFGAIEDGLVVLGSGITCGKKAPSGNWSIRSNLNQCAHSAECSVTDAQGQRQSLAPNGEAKTLRLPLDRSYWLEHAGIGYLVLPSGAERGPGKPGELVIRSSLRTPLNRLPAEVMDKPALKDWKERCRALSEGDKARSARVLEIFVDHGGDKLENASCAYFVCMRPEKKSAAQWLADPGFKILANSPSLQAIGAPGAGVQVCFYATGKLAAPGLPEIEAAQPLCLMLNEGRLIVQDPLAACTRKVAEMCDAAKLKIGGRELSLPLPGAGDPDDRYRGGHAEIELKIPARP
ncbi:MAG: hypothetical protein RL095_4126 [Verrucomicrobiota bacterium]|jgi:hypothetical protein